MTDALTRLTTALSRSYRVERELGQGGMATVYLAEDLKHDRKVAIKVLRPELAAIIGAERFLSEIKTTANLQHPHILPLFDSGVATTAAESPNRPIAEHLFYVMPFIAGESLRDRLNREKQLPIADAVRIATEIAGALDYAHRHHIIHRDIKPENILLHDGRALVADFGLALATSQAGGTRLTETGLSLGTPTYMSPEQAMGEREITARSDVYALGCVLYEMLIGEPPFTGPSTQAIVAKVMTAEPAALIGQRKSVPPEVEATVLMALEKLPADRFASAAEFAAALGGTLQVGSGARARKRAVAAPPVHLPIGLIALLVAVSGLALWGWLRPAAGHASAVTPMRVMISLQPDRPLSTIGRPFDISADGTEIVYAGDADGGSVLLLRPLADFEAHALPGTDGAAQPFFSPDGSWIGFIAGGKLQKIPNTGGAPIVLAAVPGEWGGASWGADKTIVYSLGGTTLYRIPEEGGTPSAIPLVLSATDSSRNGAAPATMDKWRWPQLLPDGEHALVSTETMLAVVTLRSGALRPLIAGRQGLYLSSGHLLYDESEGRIRVVPFDPRRLAVTGAPMPAFEAFRSRGKGESQFAVSRTGTLIYVAGGFNRSLVLVDRNGRETPVPIAPRGYRFPRFSPDGQRVAVTVDPRPSNIWVVDLRRASAVPVTTDDHNIFPIWAPDGGGLSYLSYVGGGSWGVPWILQPLDGPPRRAVAMAVLRGTMLAPSDWSRNHGFLATSVDLGGRHIVAYGIGDSAVTRIGAAAADEWDARFAPDERWIAFVSDVSGVKEVYVRPVATAGGAILVSRNGGTDPRWSADGNALYFRSGSRILRVEIRTHPAFEVTGPPRELVAGSYDFSQDNNWDVGPDGRLIMVRGDPASVGRLLVVVNWLEELKAKVNP